MYLGTSFLFGNSCTGYLNPGVSKLWVDPLLGPRVGQGGSHKDTERQLNETHSVPWAGRHNK